MSVYPPPPRRRGAAFAAFALCVACAAGGFALSRGHAAGYWLSELTGVYAGMGAGAGVFALLCGYAARLLRRREEGR